MLGRSISDQKQVVSPGHYVVTDFTSRVGSTVYKHLESKCLVESAGIEGYTITLSLVPNVKDNPRMSVYTNYQVTLTGVTFHAVNDDAEYGSHHKLKLKKVTTSNAKINILVGSLPVDGEISQESIDRGAVDARLMSGSGAEKHLYVQINPEHVNGAIVKALSKFGLLGRANISCRVNPVQQDGSAPAIGLKVV